MRKKNSINRGAAAGIYTNYYTGSAGTIQNLHFTTTTTTTAALQKIHVWQFYWTGSLAVFNSWYLMLGEPASLFGLYKRRQNLQPQLSDKLNTKQTLTHHNSVSASVGPCGFSWTPSHAWWASILSHSEPPQLGKHVHKGEPVSGWSMLIYLSDLICIIPPSADIFTF